MLALCLMLLTTYYAQNYAGIIGWSLGPDTLSATILKGTSDVIAPILQVIFQVSLDTGRVPALVCYPNFQERYIAVPYLPITVQYHLLEILLQVAIFPHRRLTKKLGAQKSERNINADNS